ncbi:hypothetical protein ACAM_1291 [Aeropyrum camini SY1 = JCM 12091]|uniref:Uncharacterized protein n=2 Tax=Aeropyrum camini TaxID=229980 RepID=U3TFE4_9CREN|nr:hypothetical protein ACAM_1291 [Aeropyrum camini SY1 = JCM 12091]
MFEIHTPLIPIYLARVEPPPKQPDEELQAGEDPVTVYYTGDEDPGPCKVAIAYLYMLEDRTAGSARIRNPALHVKIISLGLKQLSELKPAEKFDVIYIVGLSKDSLLRLLNLLRLEASEGGRKVCSQRELEEVTASRAMRLKL